MLATLARLRTARAVAQRAPWRMREAVLTQSDLAALQDTIIIAASFVCFFLAAIAMAGLRR